MSKKDLLKAAKEANAEQRKLYNEGVKEKIKEWAEDKKNNTKMILWLLIWATTLIGSLWFLMFCFTFGDPIMNIVGFVYLIAVLVVWPLILTEIICKK